MPVLHREEPKHVDDEVEVSGKVWKCQFNTDVEKHAAVARGHWITTGGLLTMFFDYFATRCDTQNYDYLPAVRILLHVSFGISVRQNELHLTTKAAVQIRLQL